jgi:hypothetical protein
MEEIATWDDERINRVLSTDQAWHAYNRMMGR